MLYIIIFILFINYSNKLNKKRDHLYEVRRKSVNKSKNYVTSQDYSTDILLDYEAAKTMKDLKKREEYKERHIESRQFLLYQTKKGRKLLRKEQKALLNLFFYDRKYFFDFTMRKHRKMEIIKELEFTDDPVLINRMLNYLAK